MILALGFVAVGLAVGAGPSFRADFPAASVVEATGGGRLVHASGFSAPGLGTTPVEAARAFLRRYGEAFGVTPRQTLVARRRAEAGRPAAVTFERSIDGLPVFDGDIVVGLDVAGAVVVVNAADVPVRVAGRARVSRRAAVRAAQAEIQGLADTGPVAAERGWRGTGEVIRPVWRVEFVSRQPPGAWRSYVDAETGRVLFRTDRWTPLSAP